MGIIEGKQSISLYVDPDVYRVICTMAADRQVKNYVIVDEALREKIERDLTADQQKVFRYRRKGKNGDATEGHQHQTEASVTRPNGSARSKTQTGRRATKRNGSHTSR